MAEPGLVGHPDNVTPRWLTDVLQYAGVDAEVTSFTASGIGTGQVGESLRFQLEGGGDLPRTVVGKFASSDPVSRQAGIDGLTYKREVHFYRNLRSRVAIQTPHVLYTDIDPQTHEFVILMEDLAPGVPGDQLHGCDAGPAELAMVQLAHLHGPVWGDGAVADPELITDNRSGESLQAVYDAVSPGFLARYDARLSRQEKAMVKLVGASLPDYAGGYAGELSLIHVDYRLDNMLFGGPYPLAVVDWQTPALGCALQDVAYFIGTSVIGERRQAIEESLVKSYHDALSGYGVALTWDTCWRYYRHYAPAGLIMAVVASMVVGETDRGNDMFMAMAGRSVRMCRELDAIGAIRG